MSDAQQLEVIEQLHEIDHWLTANARTYVPDETCSIVWKVDQESWFKRVGIMLYRSTPRSEIVLSAVHWMHGEPIPLAPLEKRDKTAFQTLLRAIRATFPDCKADLFWRSWEQAYTERNLYTNVTRRVPRKKK